jgi:threonine dehydratase
MADIDLQTIREAAERIRPLTHRTPVMSSRSFDAAAGVRAVFKCESLQRGGAFKIRGASNFLLSIPKADLPRGVVAFSSGNHAQAVAIAARDLGTQATIVMPDDAPRSKMEATKGYGANVIVYDRLREDREAIARRVASESGATVVPPFDHPWTIAGQGTAALELVEEIDDLDALLVPIGGGGLISGCSIAAKALKPSIRVIGVEPADGNDTFLSRQKGERVEIPAPKTIADGLRAPKPGAVTFPIVQRLVDDIVLVSDEEIRAAVRLMLTRMKILVEPSGAVGAAALLAGRVSGVRRPGIILSGGNADLELLRELSPTS